MRRSPFLALPLAVALLAGCGGGAVEEPADPAETSHAATEAAAASPRLAVGYDGGVQVLDGSTLEVLADLPYEGFTRLNPVGDGRHLVVSGSGGFHVLDAGAWSEPHGDHSHFWTAQPHDTGVVFAADEPGHVVAHAGRTVLFDDGTGHVVSFDSSEVAENPETREFDTPHAHHGVAVELSDGRVVVSEGDEEGRTGIRVLDATGAEIDSSSDCPAVHGETVAADETVVIGCSNGVLVYRDGAITKVASPDAFGRIGNQFGTEESPIVLGDYKTDPDAEVELTTRVSLVDTVTGELRLVDLPSSYWYRSLGRGENGEGVVLGIDGSLHLIDTAAGALVRSTPVIGAWEVQEDWQSPQPQVFTMDGTAYVSDPATRSIHAVDIETGELFRSASLDVTPNELRGVPGEAAA